MNRSEPTGKSTEIATSTLAEIYEKQGLYDRAIAIWRKLARRAPNDRRIAERIEDLGRRIEAGEDVDGGAAPEPRDREGEAPSEDIPIPPVEPDAAGRVRGAGDHESALETEAARTGPPEDDDASGTPALPDDEAFRAWLEAK